MEIEKLIIKMSQAHDEIKLKFYSRLAFDLTIRQRSLYGGDSVAPIFQAFNELQHLILGQITNILAQQKHYTDEQLINILIKKADASNLSNALKQSLDVVNERMT
jgi:hypothetical protein